ncbi:MAG: peptide chain release factor N(5)-glutamine methyltransferase [Terracidiphilus sp.]|nr:peptide chain release factor N(5)-glutamine methyltransferase [Terracidiphilus sp.]MDR3776010.1 peptide chain release factor N(5)-glutamine methyltransferase [Terracidiphilus sp.]
MPLRQWIHQGEARLGAGPHPDRARRDAELLMLHVLGKDKAWLMAHPQEILTGEDAVRYYALVDRRLDGEPIQYIIGETEFYGLPFQVNRDVLIPRPETEHLVEKAIELAGGFHRSLIPQPRIVDVGAGSGAIAVALAAKLDYAEITAIDLSAAALAVARRNAKSNGVAGKIRFLQGDLLAPVAEERFEIVVSNPPYVPQGDRDGLAVEVRDFEPGLALFAGDEGLDIYRRLIPAAMGLLVPGGFVAMEIGFGQSGAIEGLLAETGFEQTEFVPDLQGIPRVACGRRR